MLIEILWGLAPSIIVGLVLWYVLAKIIRSDRKEREVYQKIENKMREKFEAELKRRNCLKDGSKKA